MTERFRLLHRCVIFATGLLICVHALAGGSIEAGQKKAVPCAACHGNDGNSLNPQWPSLAGQHATYIVKTLKDFKSGDRQNVLMAGQVGALSDQDIEDLAAWFEAQKPAARTADPELVARGEQLYRGGDLDRGISACIACHGPNGRGNPPAAWPSLAGQHATYTMAQLHAYADGSRKSDPNRIMRSIASLLSDDDIAAVASYIQGLR